MLALEGELIVLLHGCFEPRQNKKASAFASQSPQDKFFILEGRPNLESAANNSLMLLRNNIKPTLVADNMAGFLFLRKYVKEVRVAYQDIDSQGAVCDVGAIIWGVLAKRHKVPVYLYPGKIRARFLGDPKDLIQFQGRQIAPKGTRAYVPLVEWLPKKYITKVF